MKKIYLITILFFTSAMLYAQLPSLPSGAHEVNAAEVRQTKAAHNLSSSNRVDDVFYLDYSTANFDDHFFVWQFNTLYVNADTAMNYIAIGLDSMAGYTDPANPTTTMVYYNMCSQLRIDSIFVYSTHENNSGLYDKFTVKIVTLNASGQPTTTVLWQQTDSTNVTLSPGGNWVGTDAAYIWNYAPAYTSTAGTRLGIVWEYRDPTKTDTSSVLAGFVQDPGQASGSAFQSDFKNSWMRYPPFISSITKTSNVGYGTPVGSLGWVESQNWAIWAYVTCDPSLGVNEFENEGIRLSQNRPNPCKGYTEIPYYLKKTSNVSFEVTDITGKVILSQNNGVQIIGQHKFPVNTGNLGAGVYFYTLKTNEYSLTRKMIVME